MKVTLRDSVLVALILAAFSAGVHMYADIQVLKSQFRYYHGEPVKP